MSYYTNECQLSHQGLVRQLFDTNRQRLQGWWHAAKLVNTLLRLYNDCMEESKSIQHMKGMYHMRVQSLLVPYCSFSHRQYCGRYFTRNSNFEWLFHVIALTRSYVQSFLHCSQLTYQNIHKIYMKSINFHYHFIALTAIYTTATFIWCSTN